MKAYAYDEVADQWWEATIPPDIDTLDIINTMKAINEQLTLDSGVPGALTTIIEFTNNTSIGLGKFGPNDSTFVIAYGHDAHTAFDAIHDASKQSSDNLLECIINNMQNNGFIIHTIT